MKVIYAVLLAVSLLDFAIAAVSLQSSLEVEGRTHACSGEEVVFTCTVNSIAVGWRVSSLSINVIIGPTNIDELVDAAPFDLFGTTSNGVTTSTASVNATLALNDTKIQCIDAGVPNGTTNSSVLYVVGPQSPPTGPVQNQSENEYMYLGDDRVSTVVTWNASTPVGSVNITYTVCLMMEGSTECDSTIDITSETMATVENIAFNTNYTGYITATNECGDTSNRSEDFMVRVNAEERPDPSGFSECLDCSIVGEFIPTTVSWMYADLPSSSPIGTLYPPITEVQLSYSYVNGTNVTKNLNATYTNFLLDDLIEGVYILTLSVKNAVGPSVVEDTVEVTRVISVENQTSASNQLQLQLTITLNPMCEDLTMFTAVVTYTQGTTTNTSREFGAVDNTIIVTLDDLQPGSEVSYTIDLQYNGTTVENVNGTATVPVPPTVGPTSTSDDGDDTTIIIIVVVLGAVGVGSGGGVVILVIVIKKKKSKSSRKGGDDPEQVELNRSPTRATPVGTHEVQKKKAKNLMAKKTKQKKSKSGDQGEAVELKSHEDPTAMYQDPSQIQREEYPGTHDVYALPDKARKTRKPEDHLPTYADPRDIQHEEAPETGEVYTVVDKRASKKKKGESPPPDVGDMYTQVDIAKKHKGRELNYSELQMPTGGPAPPPQGVVYASVQS